MTLPERFILPICVAIGIAMRLFIAMFTDYWHDEFWSAAFSHTGHTLDQVINDTISDVHPPLYQVLLYCWYHLFGYTELSGRVLSLLCGVAAIPAIHALASRVYNRETANLAVILFALNPFAIFFSAETRSNELLLLLSILSTTSFAACLQERSRLAYTGYFLFSLALAYTHYFGILVLLTHLLFLLVSWQSCNKPRAHSAIHLIYLLLLACYLPMFEAVVANLHREVFTIPRHSFLLLLGYIPLFLGGPFSAPLLALFAWLLYTRRKDVGFREYQILLAVAVMLLLPFWAGFFMNPIMRPKNAIIAIPLLILLISHITEISGMRYRLAMTGICLAIAIASTTYVAMNKGDHLDTLLQEAMESKVPVYLVTHEWRTAEFVFTKRDLNLERYPTLELHLQREAGNQLPERLWLACYVSCPTDEILQQYMPSGYRIEKHHVDRGIRAVLLVNARGY